ncbi:MAG: universal stress protein [Bacteriovoracia bacterium]
MLSKPNILVCTDFSPFSDDALKAADKLREQSGGTLSVLHVSEHPVIWDWLPREGSPISLDEEVEKELLSSLRKKIESQMARCEVQGENHISMGLPHQVILEEINARNIDVVVMGHKGKTGGTFRIGSMAEKVISSSPIPVLIVKRKFEMNKVAALVDPTAPMEKILNWSEELSFLLSAKLEVVSLFPDIAARYIGIGKIGFSTELLSLDQEQRSEVIREVEERIRTHLVPESKAEIKVLITAEKKLSYHMNSTLINDNVDMAIMKRHQAGFLEKILIGSETRRMLEIFEGNLFILPP